MPLRKINAIYMCTLCWNTFLWPAHPIYCLGYSLVPHGHCCVEALLIPFHEKSSAKCAYLDDRQVSEGQTTTYVRAGVNSTRRNATNWPFPKMCLLQKFNTGPTQNANTMNEWRTLEPRCTHKYPDSLLLRATTIIVVNLISWMKPIWFFGRAKTFEDLKKGP